jgi:Dehydratase medium subunit
MEGLLDSEPIYQSESFPESPAIHVAVLPDVDPVAFRWVRVGAEEEGVPCREALSLAEFITFGGEDPLAAAYAAAHDSRLGVGVAVGHGRVILHEAHMPADHPVWESPLTAELRQACRLVGCNAGRMVKRMPLRFEQEGALHESMETARAGTAPGVGNAEEQLDTADLAAVVIRIVRALQGRGIV